MRHISQSLFWVFALFLFAHSDLVDSCFNINRDFFTEYVNVQSNRGTLYSNIGFWFLAVFDRIIVYKRLHLDYPELIISALSIICLLAIYGITGLIASEEIDTYPVLMKIPFLVFWLHGIFILTLIVLKYLTLKSTTLISSNVKAKTLR